MKSPEPAGVRGDQESRRPAKPNTPLSEGRRADGAIRVCFLIDRLDSGGTEGQLLLLLRSLDRTRVEPYLCLLDGEDEVSRSLEPEDVQVLRLGIKSLRHPSTLERALRFARFLRRERIDVLQTYFFDSSYFGVPVGRLAGVRKVVRTRFMLADLLGPKQRWLCRRINRWVDAVIANSQPCRMSVIADERFGAESVLVIPNGVDLNRFVQVPEWNGDPPGNAPPSLGMVANLRPLKRADMLIEAARRLTPRYPGLRVRFAGLGTQDAELWRQAVAARLGGRVELLGLVEDVPAFLSSLDVAVLTSKSEGMPNAVLEYMAAGRPIVSTAVGGVTELIEHEVHGLLVPPEDIDALSSAIDRLLSDRALAMRLARAARQRIRDCFSAERRARAYEGFYARLLREPRHLVCASY